MAYKYMGQLAVCALILAGCSSAVAQETAPQSASSETVQQTRTFPHWMMGAWIEQKEESWAEEFWTGPRGGIMLGAARVGKGDMLQIWEQTQIRPGKDGKLAFFAMPRGAAPTEFPVVAQTENSITFENAAHDYPQRVRYWREGKLLKAEISKADGSDVYSWTYSPMGGGQ